MDVVVGPSEEVYKQKIKVGEEYGINYRKNSNVLQIRYYYAIPLQQFIVKVNSLICGYEALLWPPIHIPPIIWLII